MDVTCTEASGLTVRVLDARSHAVLWASSQKKLYRKYAADRTASMAQITAAVKAAAAAAAAAGGGGK